MYMTWEGVTLETVHVTTDVGCGWGGHLETVDVKTQVLGLKAWVTLETVDVGPQIQGLSGGVTLGTGDM